MRSFQDDWEASIAHLRCPAIHHPCVPQGKCKRIRTTNLPESSFLEDRRQTRTTPRFFSEKSCLKLAFATLWRASDGKGSG
jgi:transposase-like protein